VIGLFAGGAFALRRMLHTLAQIEERRIAPATERVTKILDDVQR
jgi:tagatose-1,6-bisphosphate aldolase non-catalytic subunit AgaZ/GatZ